MITQREDAQIIADVAGDPDPAASAPYDLTDAAAISDWWAMASIEHDPPALHRLLPSGLMATLGRDRRGHIVYVVSRANGDARVIEHARHALAIERRIYVERTT